MAPATGTCRLLLVDDKRFKVVHNKARRSSKVVVAASVRLALVFCTLSCPDAVWVRPEWALISEAQPRHRVCNGTGQVFANGLRTLPAATSTQKKTVVSPKDWARASFVCVGAKMIEALIASSRMFLVQLHLMRRFVRGTRAGDAEEKRVICR